jgi:hypothetical protein
MSKHHDAFIIRGTVRDPKDHGGVAGLTVKVLDEHLAAERRFPAAKTDEHGRFELRYSGKDFAAAMLEARPNLYLQLENAAGDVVHVTATPIVHEAVAVRGLELEVPRNAVAGAAVEHTRTFFKQLVGINPNYFGGAAATGLPQLSPLGASTQYEALGCIGLSPQDDTLEAIVVVKLPYGYGGGPCGPGTKEYVAFFIDYGDGLGWKAAGAPVEVRVHDLMATGRGEIHYAVRRAFTPQYVLPCDKPQVVRLRAILSWESIPTNPNYVPVWGEVKEEWIQLRPSVPLLPFIPLPFPSAFALFGDLQAIKTKVDASLAALAAQAASGKVEAERAQLLPILAKNPNHFGSLSKAPAGPQLLADLAKFSVVAGLDPSLLQPVPLPQLVATRYEELTCVGLYPEQDLLEATFLVKQQFGYNGDLCTTGSVEYVAFYVDFGAGFQHVGTDAVPVHDIPATAARNLAYAAKVKIGDIESKLRDCEHENIVTVRAVLSWNYDPTPFGPYYAPPWGNVLERRVSLRPLGGPASQCELELVSQIHVDEISQLGADRGYAYDPLDTTPPLAHNRPFGGIVAIHGKINVVGATRYRLMVSADGGTSWDPVRDPRYARNPLPWLGPVVRTPDAEGWLSIADYQADLASYSLAALAHWQSAGKNGPYRLRLELGDTSGPMPGQHDEVDVVLDNRGIELFTFGGALAVLPMTGVAVLDAAGQPKKCDLFQGREPIRVFGNFRDDHFDQFRVAVTGGNISGAVPVATGSFRTPVTWLWDDTGIIGAGPGSPGKELVAFDLCAVPQSPVKAKCAYAVSLTVWDRAIVGYLSGHVFATTSHSSTTYVTFDWDPAGQC